MDPSCPTYGRTLLFLRLSRDQAAQAIEYSCRPCMTVWTLTPTLWLGRIVRDRRLGDPPIPSE
jgi:hypothetical protein